MELAGLDKFTSNTVFNCDKNVHLQKLFEFLKQECGIDLKIFKNQQKSINSIMNSLTASNRVKVFSKININTIFSSQLKNSLTISKIWIDFFQIFNYLKREGEINYEFIKQNTSNWLKTFLSVYHRSDVTPYIHAFVNHLHEFVRSVDNVDHFNLEGLEKLNDMTTIDYFRATNKRKGSIKQILAKRC